MIERRWLVALSFVLASACIPFGPARRRSLQPLPDESAPRRVESLQERCGPVNVARAPLVRPPYLQQLGPESTRVLWTSAARARERLFVYPADAVGGPRRLGVEDLGPVNGASWVRHRRAFIDDLSPRTAYCYEVRDAGGRLAYGPVAFRTAPPPREGAVDVLILGDSGGGGPPQRAVRDQMLRLPADLILHAGDLGYFEATTARLEETVFRMYERMLRSIPIYPVLGDHDVKAERGAPFLAAFDLPGDERAYSFDFGPIHVAAIDSTEQVAARARWLDEDLGDADAPWTIVLAHHPPFSSGWHGGRAAVQEHVVPVLERHGVDLFVAGHEHDYERTHPIDGVTYVVTGGGGHSVRPVGAHAWTARSEAVLHFLHLRANEERMVIRAIDATGRVFDVVRLRRPPGH